MSDTSVVKGTAIAAGTGAGLYAIGNFALQKHVIKNAPRYIEGFKMVDSFAKETISALANDKTKKGILNKKYIEYSLNKAKEYFNVATTKKISGKLLGKAALVGAAVFGGAYLAYRGIKALFTKNED